MPAPASKASELYKKLIQDGYTAENIGSEEEFTKKATTKEGASKLYSVLLSEGYTTDNLGDVNEFTTKLISASPDKKKVSTTEQSALSEGLQDGGLESTTSTTETVPVQKKGKPAQIIVGESYSVEPFETVTPPDNLLSLAFERKRLFKEAEEQGTASVSGGTGGAAVSISPNQQKLDEAKSITKRLADDFKIDDKGILSLEKEIADLPSEEVRSQWQTVGEDGKTLVKNTMFTNENLSKLRQTDYDEYINALNTAKVFGTLRALDKKAAFNYGHNNVDTKELLNKPGDGMIDTNLRNINISRNNDKVSDDIIKNSEISYDKKEKLLKYNNEARTGAINKLIPNVETAKKYLSDRLAGKEFDVTPSGDNLYSGKKQHNRTEDIDNYSTESIEKLLDPNDPYDARALQVYKYTRSFNDAIKNSSNIEEAAINYVSGIDPTVAKQRDMLMADGRDLPQIQVAEYVKAFLDDDRAKELARTNPDFKEIYYQAKNGFSVKYPEYAAKVIAEKISQEREDRGMNNVFINIPTKSSTREIVDDLVAKGELSEYDKELYLRDIDPKISVGQSLLRGTVGIPFGAFTGKSPISTPGVLENALDSYNKTIQGTARSIEDIPLTPIATSDTYRLQQSLVDNYSTLKVNLTKAHEISEGTGHLIGFTIPMIYGGTALKAAGASEKAAHLINTALMFEGQNRDRALQLFPGDPAKRLTFTAISTAVDTLLTELIPTKSIRNGISNLIKKDVADITNKLATNQITKEAAGDLLIEKTMQALPKFALENAKTAGTITGFGVFHKTIESLMGASDLSAADIAYDAVKEFKQNYLLTPILTLAAIKGKDNSSKLDAKLLMQMASAPKGYKQEIINYAQKNNEPAQVTEEKLRNLDNATKVFNDLSKTNLTEPQKEKYFILSVAEKALMDKSMSIDDINIKEKYLKESEEYNKQKERILNNKDKASEYDRYEDDIKVDVEPKEEVPVPSKVIPEIKATADSLKDIISKGGEDAAQAQSQLDLLQKDPVAFFEKEKANYLNSVKSLETETLKSAIDSTVKYYNELITKIKSYDTKNIEGLPGEVGFGEKPVEAKPVEVGGAQETGGGGVLQENVPIDGGGELYHYLKITRELDKSSSGDGILISADFGRNGGVTWEIPNSQISDGNKDNPKYLIVQSIDRNKDLSISEYKGKKDSIGEGTKAIASLFFKYPSLEVIGYDDYAESGFWQKIGGNVDTLDRNDFFKYFEKKYGSNPDIIYGEGKVAEITQGEVVVPKKAFDILSKYEKGTIIDSNEIITEEKSDDDIVNTVFDLFKNKFKSIKISGKRPTEGAAFYNKTDKQIDLNKNSDHWNQVESSNLINSLSHEYTHHLLEESPNNKTIEKDLNDIKNDLIKNKPQNMTEAETKVFDYMTAKNNSPQEIITYAVSNPEIRKYLAPYAERINAISNQIIGKDIITEGDMKSSTEIPVQKSEKELGIEKKEPIFVEQKTKDEQTVRPESRGERTGREGVRTIAPLEGAPSVPGINGGDPQLVAVAEEYAKQNGIPLKRQAEYAKVDEGRARRIADEYEKMKHDPQNPRVKEAYQNLIKQTIAQYKALVDAGYKFWFIDANIPSNAEYASSPYNALRDARQNKTMGVFPTTDGFGTNESIDVSDNPLMEETGFYWSVGGLDGQKKPVLANDLFRAVHDMFGHGLEGAGFRARGEENAWQAHIRLYTGSAIGALTSETRGQNSWLNYGKYGEQNQKAKTEDTIFADQKTGLMPEWTWTEGRVGDMEEAKTKPQQIGEGLLSHLGIPVGEKETKFSKITGEPEVLTSKEVKEKEIVNQMNSMDLVNKGIDLSSPSTTKEKIDVNELNSRLDNQLDSVKWEDYEGIPFTFTISDQLRTGDIKNPNTGEVITDLKGGIGFNGTEGNENNAWANTTKEEAEGMLQRAKDVYQNNKPLFDKLWKEGKLPDGHIPMAVVKMAETSILSNEAVFRTGIQNIETLPKANRKKAVSELAKSMKAKIDAETKSLKKGVDKNGEPYTKNTIKLKKKSIIQYQKILDSIKENKYDDIVDVLKDKDNFSLPEKTIIANEIFYGKPTPIGGKEIDITKSRPNTPVSKTLIGNKNPALINLGKITDLLTEPSMKNVPNMHIVSIVGVDVKNPKVNKISHTNYPYGVKGKSIGILESPVHMKDAFGEAYGSTLSQIVKNEADNASISVKNALTQGIPVQSGLPNRVFKSAIAKGRLDAVDKLSGFLRQAFPNTTFFTSQEAWDAAMADPSIKKKLKDGDVVYAFTTDGNVFINPKLKTTKATLHETGHIWTSFVKENNPELHQKGLDLVSGTKEHQRAINEYGDTELAREEALMELMSTKGETILNAAQKAQFKEWLLTVYKYISENFKSLMGLSPKEIENLTLDKFLEGMLSDILSGKELTTKKLKSEAKFSLESQNARIKDYIEIQRKAGETDADIRAGIESVADRLGLSKEDIDALMKKEAVREAPVQENPFENIPKTQVARDKYFDTTFGENADKAREIYNQGGTPAEMLAKMQEAGLEPPVPPTEVKTEAAAPQPEKVGITKADIKELAIKYDLEIAERREAISDAEIERMAKELIANGYDVNKLVKESLEPEKRPLTDIEANILAEVAADMKAKIDKNSSDADIAKYRDVLSALNKGISENARGLRMAKVKKNVVESIADVMADMMIDMKQDELTTEQRKEAEKRFNDLKDALDKETELRKQAEQEIDRLNAELEIKKQKARTENKPKKSKQDYASERKAIIQSIKDKWNKASKGEGGLTMAVVPYQSQLMAIAPDVAKLVKSYLEQGAATTLEEVRALLKKDIQDVGIDVKDEDVRELIAGNYNKKKPTRSQYAKKMYELRQEEKLLLQIEALERGEEPITEKKRIEKNQKLKELRDKIKELTGKEVPKDEKFQQAVNARIKANQKKQSEIQDKVNRGDFSPEVKKQSILENTELQENNKALYDSYLKSVLDKDEALLNYEKARMADKMKNRGKVEKLADGVDTLLTTSKGTVAMFDQSVFLVQMLPFAYSHPFKLVQFAARAMKDFANKKAFDEKMAVLHSSGLWDLIEKSGLAIYEPKTAKAELRNELHGGDKNIWNKDMKVGGYNISPGQAFERATSSALNNARLYLFMNRVQDLNNAGKTFENSPKEFEAAARFANEFTGHGKVQEDIAKTTNLLNKFIWSPKMFASTFNILGLGDIARPVATVNAIARRLGITTKESSRYKGFYTSLTPEQGKFAVKELTRFILTGITIMYTTKLISMLSGDDDDKVKVDMNPTSSNFANMNIDGKNIAVFGRFASAVRTICQALLSEKTTSTGETKALGEGYGNKTSGEVVFGSFVRGKMTPASGLAYDFFLNNRKNYYTKEELTAKEIAKQSFVPMSARDIIKDFDRDGALIGTLETIAKLYGTSIRDERDFIKAEKPTFTELEMKDENDKKVFDFLKKYEVPVPVFQDKKKYRLEVDAKHPEAGKTKDGEPYALYSDEEFKMYNDFKKDYIIKALKILNRLDKSGTVKLSKEVIEDKLKSIESQASRVAKNKLIAKGKIARKNKEETDTDITISEEFAELFSEENPEE